MANKRKCVDAGAGLVEEMLTFFTLEKQEVCELLADETWSAKLSYFMDISEQLN